MPLANKIPFLCAGRRFELVIQELMLDWTTDRNGASHTANVLSDAGFIRLSKPEPKEGAKEAAPEGTRCCRGVCTSVCCLLALLSRSNE